MLEQVREYVQMHSLTRVSRELHQMQFTLEAVTGGQELILSLAQAQVVEMQGAFLPTTLEGDQSPDVSKEGHILDEADGEGEPYIHEDYELWPVGRELDD